MNLGTSLTTDPPPAVDQLAVRLVQQASLLARLAFRRSDAGLSRTEAGLLGRLEARSERITALAGLDGLAQPTVTLMVKRLETDGLVRRERSPEDGRVVLVSLTPAGHEAIAQVRDRYRERLRACLTDLPADDIDALEPAIRAMETLIERLQKEASR